MSGGDGKRIRSFLLFNIGPSTEPLCCSFGGFNGCSSTSPLVTDRGPVVVSLFSAVGELDVRRSKSQGQMVG